MPKKPVKETKELQVIENTTIDPKLTTTVAQKVGNPRGSGSDSFVVPEQKITHITKPKQLKMIKQTVDALLQCNNNKMQASKMLNITDRALWKRLENYPIIVEKLKSWHAQTVELARLDLQGNSLNAVHNVVKLMNSSSERIQLDSAIEVLDRSGITKPNTQVQVNVLNDLRKDKEQYNL